jgi:hypothetical protein
MPYLRVPFSLDDDFDTAEYVRSTNGKVVTLTIRETPGSSECFSVLDDLLVQKGVARRVRVGEANSMMMTSESLVETVVAMLREDPLLLLRTDVPSGITRRRREYMENMEFGRQLAP